MFYIQNINKIRLAKTDDDPNGGGGKGGEGGGGTGGSGTGSGG